MNAKPDKMIPALYGGIIIGLISSIPVLSLLNLLCCAPVIFGGFIAVYFYKNDFTPDTPPMTTGDCVAVGALAGVFGAIIATIVSIIITSLFGNVSAELILEWLRNAELDLPEEAWEMMEESMSQALTVGAIITGLIISLVIDTIFGLLGGLIGYAVFKPKQQTYPTIPPQNF